MDWIEPMLTKHQWTKDELIAFEKRVADAFNEGKIRAPVHLAGGNEDQLLEIFKDIGPDDWVCGAWRMQYNCLLKGIPEEQLFEDIVAGHSITLCYPKYRIISSAIVGGILPIAVGLAWSIKHKNETNKVWCFLGDMTAHTGIFEECSKYAWAFKLPITWIIENNQKSVCTDTEEVWGGIGIDGVGYGDARFVKYELPYPHSGAGKRINF